ncbi:hypothetical protein TNCV_3478081 [Trichonephila clavipes]|nr:hypothetical protein TNCV_3478081 [Trichonephila clavipes]
MIVHSTCCFHDVASPTQEITDFVQSIAKFQECDEEDVEFWMAYHEENFGVQIINDDEIVTFVQEESGSVDDENDED